MFENHKRFHNKVFCIDGIEPIWEMVLVYCVVYVSLINKVGPLSAGSHPPVSQSGGAGDSQTHSVRLRELDRLLCCHRTPSVSSTGNDRVQERGSHPALMLGTKWYPAPQYEQHTSGAGGERISHPLSISPSTEMGNQDRVMAHYVTIHSAQGRYGDLGMAWWPIHMIRNISPRPPYPLWRTKCRIIYMPKIGPQEGWPHRDWS